MSENKNKIKIKTQNKLHNNARDAFVENKFSTTQ